MKILKSQKTFGSIFLLLVNTLFEQSRGELFCLVQGNKAGLTWRQQNCKQSSAAKIIKRCSKYQWQATVFSVFESWEMVLRDDDVVRARC